MGGAGRALCVGLSPSELKIGASIAQIKDNSINNIGHFLWENIWNESDFDSALEMFDDASDHEAIEIGICLYEQFKNSLSSMTAEDIMREVLKIHKEGKTLNIKSCTRN